jgi:hypothetical protein
MEPLSVKWEYTNGAINYCLEQDFCKINICGSELIFSIEELKGESTRSHDNVVATLANDMLTFNIDVGANVKIDMAFYIDDLELMENLYYASNAMSD